MNYPIHHNWVSQLTLWEPLPQALLSPLAQVHPALSFAELLYKFIQEALSILELHMNSKVHAELQHAWNLWLCMQTCSFNRGSLLRREDTWIHHCFCVCWKGRKIMCRLPLPDSNVSHIRNHKFHSQVKSTHIFSTWPHLMQHPLVMIFANNRL